MDGYREHFPAEDSVGGGDSPSLRGGRRVCRRAGRGRGRGAGGHRPVGRAPSPLTSESLPQTRLSSPAPPAGRRKAPGKRPLWGTLFLGSVYLSAASGSVRALCPTPLPADQRSARRQQRPLRGWLRARPASAHFKSFLWPGRGRREPWLSTSGCCASQGCAPGARGCWGPGSASPGLGRKRGCGASVLSGTRPWRRGTGQSPGRGSWGSFRASLGADRAQAGRSSAAPPPGGARRGEDTPAPGTQATGNAGLPMQTGGCSWWLSGTLH